MNELEWAVAALVFIVIVLIARVGRLQRRLGTLEEQQEVMQQHAAASSVLPKDANGEDLDIYDEVEDSEALAAESEIVGQINMICKVAAMSARNLAEPDKLGEEMLEYERKRFNKMKDNALEQAGVLRDEFLRGAALHSIIDLCVAAGELDEARKLFSEITNSFIREQVIERNPVLGP